MREIDFRMSILIKSAKIIDASSKFNGKTKDIFINQGKIQEIADCIVKKSAQENAIHAKNKGVEYYGALSTKLKDMYDKQQQKSLI